MSIELGDVNAADSNAVELDMDGWNLLITVTKALCLGGFVRNKKHIEEIIKPF